MEHHTLVTCTTIHTLHPAAQDTARPIGAAAALGLREQTVPNHCALDQEFGQTEKFQFQHRFTN